ncbi:MAG: hypothetical protein HOV80_31695 [Polyangiaceae bacterium]|nr:hypothetical protein [Polyangiaceae bacterium]
MSARIARIKKLLELREHGLKKAQAIFAAAERDTVEKRGAAAREADRWLGAVEEANALRSAQVDDFIMARADVAALRRAVEGREKELATANAALARATGGLIHANREVRQMELYMESAREQLRILDKKLDRTLSDELADRARRTKLS